tara:strand:+ start:1114 stop:1275 length:162 start_codon:yes stop_codon:yes gene_type:complete
MNWHNEKKQLYETVSEIADIIYMELPLEYQDVWLKRVIDRGMWTPEKSGHTKR